MHVRVAACSETTGGWIFFISLPTMSWSESSVFRQVTFHYLLGYVIKAFISHLISNCWFYYSPCTDVFCRQLRILRFTCRREHCKCKAGCTSSDGISRDKRTPRERERSYLPRILGQKVG